MKQPPPSFQFRTDRGIEGIDVVINDPHDPHRAANLIASFYLSTWGDPMDTRLWGPKNPQSWEIAQRACNGEVLPNTLETLPLTFSVNGVSRATTHQLVRSRVGAVFGQQGGRDNNWTDFNIRIPETWWGDPQLVNDAEDHQIHANELYKKALAAGIPFQDARYILPMGLETALFASYNLLSFKGLAERRLCNRMMWETNYIVRLMTDLVVVQYPFVGKNLRSSCEKRGTCGSVSPMFPPSCVTKNKGEVHMAKDNSTLQKEMNDRVMGLDDPISLDYDFQLWQNGTYKHFAQIDSMRLFMEEDNPDGVYSMVNPEAMLIEKNQHGIWSAA